MEKIFPDKYIRKALFDVLNGITVSGNTIYCYDTRVTGVQNPDHYILLTTQTNAVDKNNKCEWFWDSSILIDVVTRYDRPGNPGSRLLADDIMNEVRDLTNNLVLEGGLSVIKQTQNFPNDITTITNDQAVYRKLMRLELKIK